MNKLFRIFGIAAIIAVIGFSFAACSNGSTGGDVIPAEWVGTYVGNDTSTATLYANGGVSWTGWSIPNGERMGATVTEGGTLSGSNSGKWVYLNINGSKEGIIIYLETVYQGKHYFVGIGNRGGNGVAALVSTVEGNGVVFSPSPTTTYPTNYGFWGGK